MKRETTYVNTKVFGFLNSNRFRKISNNDLTNKIFAILSNLYLNWVSNQCDKNLTRITTFVVNGNLGAGCLQPNEYAMYLCMSSTDLYCALYICFGRGSKKNKRKKKVATRYHVALCCSSNSTAWTPKSVIIWIRFS